MELKRDKCIFVFDLDNTLGVKKHFYTAVTKENIEFVRNLADEGHLTCFATDRPKRLAMAGMYLLGLTDYEIEKLFPVRVYEDGLFVEINQNVFYNALDFAHPKYKELKNIAFNNGAVEFFAINGFSLYPNSVIKNVNGKFLHMDYEYNQLSADDLNSSLSLVYRQDNDVRETYKFPDYFFPNLETLHENTLRLNKVVLKYLDECCDWWSETAFLKSWLDSVDVYPKLEGTSTDRKAIALSNALGKFRIQNNTKIYACCDGQNDISIIEWVKNNFSDYIIVCPSNIKKELLKYLGKQKLHHIILKESCENLHLGLGRMIHHNNF